VPRGQRVMTGGHPTTTRARYIASWSGQDLFGGRPNGSIGVHWVGSRTVITTFIFTLPGHAAAGMTGVAFVAMSVPASFPFRPVGAGVDVSRAGNVPGRLDRTARWRQGTWRPGTSAGMPAKPALTLGAPAYRRSRVRHESRLGDAVGVRRTIPRMTDRHARKAPGWDTRKPNRTSAVITSVARSGHRMLRRLRS
jgi:hypothetical protein